jgi:anti-sigma regulatory factor (Ser/Thr protein kinase)
MIEVELGIIDSELKLSVPAEEGSLPVVRQALRSLGESVGAPVEDLEDAELAVTEACANAVEHAYPDGSGTVEVVLCPSESGIEVSVRDWGRGMPSPGELGEEGRGFGLAMIEGIAKTLDVRSNGGTEIAMDFALNSGPNRPPARVEQLGVDPSERILRRLVAVVAAQADMTTDRLVEALLVAELVARHGLRHLVGDCLRIGLERSGGRLRLRLGPLEAGGAAAVVADSDVPVVGPVIERLADELETDRQDSGEYLTVAFAQS